MTTVQQDAARHALLRKHGLTDMGLFKGDSLNGSGAAALADRIKNYWHSRGHTNVVMSVVEISGVTYLETIYMVRSNLVRGLPPARIAA